jgi:hypothetical protein
VSAAVGPFETEAQARPRDCRAALNAGLGHTGQDRAASLGSRRARAAVRPPGCLDGRGAVAVEHEREHDYRSHDP